MSDNEKKLLKKGVGLFFTSFPLNVIILGMTLFPYLLIYFIVFSWWLGGGDFIFGLYIYSALGYGLYTGIVSPLSLYKRELKLETERQIRHNAQPEVRIQKMLTQYPVETKKILNEVANNMSSKYEIQGRFGVWSQPLRAGSLTPTVLKVNNEERLTIVEKELEKSSELPPSMLTGWLERAVRVSEVQESNGIPYLPLLQKVQSLGFTTERVKSYHQESLRYEQFYNNARAYLEKEVAIIGAGIGGENRVNQELDMYENMWTSFANVRFEVSGQSVESDNIIVSRKGIFTLEVKNYSPKGNYGIRITKDGQWLKVFSNGQEEPMNNVTSQMNRHIALKQNLLQKEYKEKHQELSQPYVIQPVFVIANDTVRIQNETDLPIMRISQIYHHIMKLPDILSDEEVANISSIIQENMLPAKTYELDSFFPQMELFYENMLLKAGTVQKLEDILSEYQKESRTALLDFEKTVTLK